MFVVGATIPDIYFGNSCKLKYFNEICQDEGTSIGLFQRKIQGKKCRGPIMNILLQAQLLLIVSEGKLKTLV